MEGVGMPSGGPICHETQLPVGLFYLTSAGSHGNSNGCLLIQLGYPGLYAFLSFPLVRKVLNKLCLTRDETHCHGPVLASEGMVRGLDAVGKHHLPHAMYFL